MPPSHSHKKHHLQVHWGERTRRPGPSCSQTPTGSSATGLSFLNYQEVRQVSPSVRASKGWVLMVPWRGPRPEPAVNVTFTWLLPRFPQATPGPVFGNQNHYGVQAAGGSIILQDQGHLRCNRWSQSGRLKKPTNGSHVQKLVEF